MRGAYFGEKPEFWVPVRRKTSFLSKTLAKRGEGRSSTESPQKTCAKQTTGHPKHLKTGAVPVDNFPLCT
jgi:hypothetical protein